MTGRTDRHASGHPGAARPDADSESGTEPDDPEKAVFALESMFRRGLIDRATYERRREALNAGTAMRGDRTLDRPTPGDPGRHHGAAGGTTDDEAGG